MTTTAMVRLHCARAPYVRAGLRFASTRVAVEVARALLSDAQIAKLKADPLIKIEYYDVESAPDLSAPLAKAVTAGPTEASRVPLSAAVQETALGVAPIAAEQPAEDVAKAEAQAEARAAQTAADVKALADAQAQAATAQLAEVEAGAKLKADTQAVADAKLAKAGKTPTPAAAAEPPATAP